MNAPYDPARLAQMLGTVRHFRSLHPSDQQTIIAAGQVRRYAADETLFHEGTPCAGLHVLIQGRVQLLKLGPDGRQQIMSVHEPVIMFNEVPVLDGGNNVATAVATQSTVIWRTPRDAFLNLLDRYPQMGRGLLEVLARRNRFLISQYEDLSFRSVVARTAKLILELSQQGAMAIERRTNPNTDLAARMATVPEAFSRALSVLRKEELIRCTRERITVLAPDGLAGMADL